MAEIVLCSQPWKGPFHMYGGLACNALMADSWSDRSPLHDAAYQGRLLNLRTLVSQAGTVSTDGATPLFNACSSGSAACVRLILQHSPNIHATHHLASPIHEAAKKGHRECLELFLTHGAHIDQELPVVGSPLYSACLAQAKDCVERLLHSGADVRIGCGQDSPLHAAVRRGGVDIVELLLDYGADGSCRNAEGKTPLELTPPNSTVRTTLQKRGPCSLSHLCRFSIRRSLGRSRLYRASGLSLPHTLRDFLLYQ